MFTVSAVTGITFRFVLAHDNKARYEDSVPQFAKCCGEESGSFVAVNTRLICDARKAGEEELGAISSNKIPAGAIAIVRGGCH